MGLQVINEEITEHYTLVKFVFGENFTKDEFRKFLGILSSLLDIASKTDKPFGFYVDAQKSYVAPLNAAKGLISWKRKETPRIKNERKLVASAVAIKSTTLTNMINTALKISPNVSPNVITTDVEKAKRFVIGHLHTISNTRST